PHLEERLMNRKRMLLFSALILLFTTSVRASIFGDVLGVVRDPQKQTVKDAKVTLRSRTSDLSKSGSTNDNGEFFFRGVPVGEYLVTVEANGFRKIEQSVTVVSGSAPVLQIQLEIAPLSQQMNVRATPEQVGSESAT